MPRTRHPLRSMHVATLGTLVAALPALTIAYAPPAPKAKPTQARQIPRTLPVAPALATFRRSPSRAQANGLRDAGRAAPQPAIGAVHALRGFKLQFQNGDHKVRRIGVVAEDRFVTFAFADSNGDDPFLGHAEFVTLSSGRMAEVAGIGGGKFEIPLPAGPAGHVPVLAGFEFRRTDGTDANLRNVGVWLDAERGVARVSLVDDQGLDLRGFEAAIGATIGSVILPGVAEWMAPVAGVTTPIIGDTIGRRAIQTHYDGKRGFQARVRYAWIPRAAVQAFGAMAGTDRDTSMPANWQAATRVDLLQGFEFTFMNSDHHLLGIAVNDLWPTAPAAGSAPAPITPRPAQGISTGQPPVPAWTRQRDTAAPATQAPPPVAKGVVFQDNNKDDPVQWSYTYVTLRGDDAQ